jgi:large subunit ribosomal protein L11
MGEVTIRGLIEGGKATSGPPFGPALGPLGVNVAKIIGEINSQTAAYEGIKVPVSIMVDTATKSYHIEVGMPPTSALILKEIGAQKGSKTKEEVAGNITLEQLEKVAKAKEKALYGGSLKARVKQLVGTCVSMNITVEGKSAKEFIKLIDAGEVKVG